MDALCLKGGIVTPQIAASGNGEIRFSDKSSLSASQTRSSPWGFTFRHPLSSIWPGGKNRYEPAIATDDAVLMEEKEDIDVKEREDEVRGENWVLKILHVTSMWKGESGENLGENDLDEIEECDVCAIDDDGVEQIKFDRKSFSKLLRRLPLAEARLYAKMSSLGCLAYSISEIKPANLQRKHGLRFVTSSIEKREHAQPMEEANEETNPVTKADDDSNDSEKGQSEGDVEEPNGSQISASAAYEIAASAASYLHYQTRSLFRFKSSNSMENEGFPERIEGINDDMLNQDFPVTAVVAAKEEVKQAVADDLNSTLSSPCEWFICDDDQSATRLFVIQGSESLASWQANLLFEPIQFEGLDVLVHRGIYEAAKGIYEQMLPEIRVHLETHGDRATLRFTGHSLGGSLSLLINLMLLIRGEVPRSSLLPVITFGAPSIMCGGDRLLRKLRLPRSHVRSITMHRDIVPRVFSCNYPNHVTRFLKAINGNFRNHPCLDKQKLLYAPMGELIILQPDDKFSPNHDLLPRGSGLYVMTGSELDVAKAEKQIQAAQAKFFSSPHPLEILSDRSAYGYGGTIQRDHDMDSYLKSIRYVIRQELSRKRKVQREQRRKVWWPLAVPFGRTVMGKRTSMVEKGRESFKRFTRLITLPAMQHMHLLLIVLFPARMVVLGALSLINFH